MPQPEWYRRTTWSATDAEEFQARLRRARGTFHRAQYLRIQALHLEEIGTEPMLRAALGLLEQLISECPDPSQLASAYHQRARCLAELGACDAALEAYRRSFEAQRQVPTLHVDAYRDFGELVVALGRSDLYDEVLARDEEFGGNDAFPAHRFQTATTRALIAAERGQREEARRFAEVALGAAAATEAPFRYHRKLGLVRHADPDVLRRLRALAA
jgi:tetratricopeptide (TPR) repeat protein